MKEMFPIKGVDDLEVVFGGKMEELLPSYEDIPQEFKNWNGRNKWNSVVNVWFFSGLPVGTRFAPKEGVSPAQAIRHISAILVSFAPKHEHKEAGVAYLLSQWFTDIILPENKHGKGKK